MAGRSYRDLFLVVPEGLRAYWMDGAGQAPCPHLREVLQGRSDRYQNPRVQFCQNVSYLASILHQRKAAVDCRRAFCIRSSVSEVALDGGAAQSSVTTSMPGLAFAITNFCVRI